MEAHTDDFKIHTPAEWFQPEGRAIGLKRIVLALLLTEDLNPNGAKAATRS